MISSSDQPEPAAAASAENLADAALEMLLAGATQMEVAEALFGGSMLALLRHMSAAVPGREMREIAAMQEHLRAQRLEVLKGRVLEELFAMSIGLAEEREAITIEQMRGRDARRRACVAMLRLRGYPTSRDRERENYGQESTKARGHEGTERERYERERHERGRHEGTEAPPPPRGQARHEAEGIAADVAAHRSTRHSALEHAALNSCTVHSASLRHEGTEAPPPPRGQARHEAEGAAMDVAAAPSGASFDEPAAVTGTDHQALRERPRSETDRVDATDHADGNDEALPPRRRRSRARAAPRARVVLAGAPVWSRGHEPTRSVGVPP